MMNALIEFAQNHAPTAHWFLFLAALLAGLNIPISIDLLFIIGATLAATLVPELTFHYFAFLLSGCIISAWIAYSLGRFIGPKIVEISPFNKLLSPKLLERVKQFYNKRGSMALVIGRFIPFGIRNCLYMSTGISKMPFYRFALVDGLACSLWATLSFFLYYNLGKNIETLYAWVKRVNFLIFIAFSVTVIGIIWYKKKKKIKEKNV